MPACSRALSDYRAGFFMPMDTCKYCDGVLSTRPNGPHIEQYCIVCGRHCRFVSKVKAGIAPRTCQTTHKAIKPKQRSEVLERAARTCEMCGSKTALLHVGHFLSVAEGLRLGLTDAEINSSENLFCMCEECNLGVGPRPLPLKLVAAIIRARCDVEGKRQ